MVSHSAQTGAAIRHIDVEGNAGRGRKGVVSPRVPSSLVTVQIGRRLNSSRLRGRGLVLVLIGEIFALLMSCVVVSKVHVDRKARSARDFNERE